MQPLAITVVCFIFAVAVFLGFVPVILSLVSLASATHENVVSVALISMIPLLLSACAGIIIVYGYWTMKRWAVYLCTAVLIWSILSALVHTFTGGDNVSGLVKLIGSLFLNYDFWISLLAVVVGWYYMKEMTSGIGTIPSSKVSSRRLGLAVLIAVPITAIVLSPVIILLLVESSGPGPIPNISYNENRPSTSSPTQAIPTAILEDSNAASHSPVDAQSTTSSDGSSGAALQTVTDQQHLVQVQIPASWSVIPEQNAASMEMLQFMPQKTATGGTMIPIFGLHTLALNSETFCETMEARTVKAMTADLTNVQSNSITIAGAQQSLEGSGDDKPPMAMKEVWLFSCTSGHEYFVSATIPDPVLTQYAQTINAVMASFRVLSP